MHRVKEALKGTIALLKLERSSDLLLVVGRVLVRVGRPGPPRIHCEGERGRDDVRILLDVLPVVLLDVPERVEVLVGCLSTLVEES